VVIPYIRSLSFLPNKGSKHVTLSFSERPRSHTLAMFPLCPPDEIIYKFPVIQMKICQLGADYFPGTHRDSAQNAPFP
jgi:hypothetical protein